MGGHCGTRDQGLETTEAWGDKGDVVEADYAPLSSMQRMPSMAWNDGL